MEDYGESYQEPHAEENASPVRWVHGAGRRLFVVYLLIQLVVMLVILGIGIAGLIDSFRSHAPFMGFFSASWVIVIGGFLSWVTYKWLDAVFRKDRRKTRGLAGGPVGEMGDKSVQSYLQVIFGKTLDVSDIQDAGHLETPGPVDSDNDLFDGYSGPDECEGQGLGPPK